MARRPTQSGFAPVSLHVIPGKVAIKDRESSEIEEERTSIDPGPPRSADDGWDESGTSVDDGASIDTTGSRGDSGHSTIDEPTVEDQARPLPPLSLVPPLPKPAAPKLPGARLAVIGGNDTGRDFVLDPARPLTVGRAIDNDVVLTDIAVSRKHLDLAFDGEYWVLRDRGSGNGTLVNERIEDGSCRLHHGDRVEIGNTVFRFEHPGGVAPATQLGWGQGDDDELSTVAGRSLRSEMQNAKADAVATVPVTKMRAPLPAPTTSAPRARTPSSTQPPPSSGEQRLVLPPMPPGASAPVEAMLPGPRSAPIPVISPTGAYSGASMLSSRHLTTTARVEPRTFSGGLAYPFVVRPPSRARSIAAVAALLIGVTAIGLIAKATTKDDPRGTAAAGGASLVEPAPPPPPPVVKTVLVPVPTPTPMIEPIPAPIPAPAPKQTTATVTPIAPAPKQTTATAPAPVPAPAPTPKTTPAPKPKVVAVVAAPRPVAPRPVAPPPRTEVAPRPKQTTAKISTSPATRTETHPKATAPDATAPKTTPKSTLAARKKAAQQYADDDYRGAAVTLRETADAGDPTEGVPLRVLAGEYEAVGEAMDQGAAAASRPVDAFAAYSRALLADRRAGGAQRSEIREKLGEFAPKAAASYMAKSNYEAAKRAADSAADYGEGSSPLVQQVRTSLEHKSGEFLATAQKMFPTAPEDAKGLLRRIMKMVAPDSPTYQKAYALLNTRPKPRDDDE